MMRSSYLEIAADRDNDAITKEKDHNVWVYALFYKVNAFLLKYYVEI